MRDFKAVIFDMDGTLIDSIEADYLAWKRLFLDYKISLSYSQYMPLLGVRSADVARKYLPLNSEEEIKNALARKLIYFEEIIEVNGINAMPFADKFLSDLTSHNLFLALATSSRKVKMELVMKRVALLKFFEVVVTAEDVKNGKPAPDIFLTTASRLGLPADQCIVFEDAINGIAAAKKAGMTCVALSSERTAGMLSDADLIIDTYQELSFLRLKELLQYSSK